MAENYLNDAEIQIKCMCWSTWNLECSSELYESSWLQPGDSFQWCLIVILPDKAVEINNYILMFGSSSGQTPEKGAKYEKKPTEGFGCTELVFACDLELYI